MADTLIQLFADLPELEKVELLRAAGIIDDRPDTLRPRGGTILQERESWIRPHRALITPLILRAVDPTDDEIAALVAAGDLTMREPANEQATQNPDVRVIFTADLSETPQSDGPIWITELAATSAALTEMFIHFAAANRPFGSETLPPKVKKIEGGSIEYTIGGGLLATGLSLIAGCSVGLVVAVAGVSMIGVGIIDKALGWPREVATMRQTERGVAWSGLIPSPKVKENAKSQGLTEGYANHMLNRTLRPYQQARRHMPGWTFKTESINQ